MDRLLDYLFEKYCIEGDTTEIETIVNDMLAESWEQGFENGKDDKTGFNTEYLNPYK